MSGTTTVGGIRVKLGADSSEFDAAMAKAQGAIRSLAMIGAAATAAIGVAVAKTAGFDYAITSAAAKTNTGAKDMDKAFRLMRASALEVAATTKFTASEVSSGMEFMAMAGYDVAQITASIAPAATLAAAATMDLGSASNIVTNIMSAYGMQIEELGGALDTVVSTTTGANLDVRMLGDAFKYAGPIAKSAGMRFEELTAAIGLLGNAGIQGSMAGTTMRQMIIALLNPTKEGAAALESMGVKATGANGRLRSLTEIITELQPHASRTGELMTIFGARAGPGVAALLEAGGPAFAKFVERLDNAGGTAKRLADVQIQTLSGQFAILKSQIDDLTIDLGTRFSPAVRRITAELRSLAKAAKEMPDGVKDTGAVLLELTAVAGSLAAVLAAVGFVIGPLKVGFAALTTVVGTIVLNPVTLALAAVAVAGYAVMEMIEELRKMSIKPVLAEIGEGGIPTRAFSPGTGRMEQITPIIRQDFGDATAQIKGFADAMGKEIDVVKLGLTGFIGLSVRMRDGITDLAVVTEKDWVLASEAADKSTAKYTKNLQGMLAEIKAATGAMGGEGGATEAAGDLAELLGDPDLVAPWSGAFDDLDKSLQDFIDTAKEGLEVMRDISGMRGPGELEAAVAWGAAHLSGQPGYIGENVSLGGVTGTAGGLPDVTKTLSKDFQPLSDTAREATAQLGAFGTVIASLATGDYVGAAVAGGAAVLQSTDSFGELAALLNSLFTMLGTLIDPLIRTITTILAPIFAAVGEAFAAIAPMIQVVLAVLNVALMPVLAVLYVAVKAFAVIAKVVGAVFKAVVDVLKAVFGPALDLLKTAFNWVAGVLSGIADAFGAAWNFVLDTLDKVFGWIPGVGKALDRLRYHASASAAALEAHTKALESMSKVPGVLRDTQAMLLAAQLAVVGVSAESLQIAIDSLAVASGELERSWYTDWLAMDEWLASLGQTRDSWKAGWSNFTDNLTTWTAGMGAAAGSAAAAAESLDKLTESITNVPRGFNLDLRRQEAALAGLPGQAGIQWLGRQGEAASRWQVNIGELKVQADDPQSLYQQLEQQARRGRYLSASTTERGAPPFMTPTRRRP